jgi:putative NADH-flavin reductase
MKIAIIGANGKFGRLLVEEAIKRDHEVLAVVRENYDNVNPQATILIKDLFDLKYADIHDCETVIDAFGTWDPKTLPLHTTSLMHLANILSEKSNRLLVVGSAGSLYVDREHQMRLVDSPEMPEMFRPLAAAMAEAFDKLRNRNDVKWTYLSPPGFFDADAPQTGRYKSGKDELLFNSDMASTISYADAAIALIDEIEHPKHIGERFTIAGA